MTLREQITPLIKGDVLDDTETITTYSRDTSIFERKPQVVVFPKDAEDVAALVRFVNDARARGEDISLTARSAGTDMTGGPLTDSIVVVFTKYMDHIGEIGKDFAWTEPGVYYRDFEKATLAKSGALLASYPASRELCAMGGIVSNNSGGELTLQYGKTAQYVRELEVVLSDGSSATLRPLSMDELAEKEAEHTLEGKIYRDMHTLITENRDEMEKARPTVTKNSAGYYLWNVMDEQKGTFDLTQIVCGSQGTLAFLMRAKLGLITPKPHHAMLVIFITDLNILPEVVSRVLAHKPESFESYDDKTFSLAVKFMPQMLRQMGLLKAIQLGFSFIPEVLMTLRGGVPKLILLAQFAEETADDALEKVRQMKAALANMSLQTKIARDESAAEKYWKVRREAFALLRKKMKDYYAAPFIDDFSIHPQDYPRFLPELYALLEESSFVYAIQGHVGDGNFHIFPLADMSKPEVHRKIMDLMPKVFALVQKYGGSITGEHNDGIIRTPYLSYQFSPKMLELFAEVKKIWDPQGVFNPGKKTGGTIEDIERDMITKV